MSFASQHTQQVFPFSSAEVFDRLVSVLPGIGLTIKDADRDLGRIRASSSASLMSWGENIALAVESVDEKSCRVELQSSLKVGLNVGGADRHQRNFDAIIAALSRVLFTTAAA